MRERAVDPVGVGAAHAVGGAVGRRARAVVLVGAGAAVGTLGDGAIACGSVRSRLTRPVGGNALEPLTCAGG